MAETLEEITRRITRQIRLNSQMRTSSGSGSLKNSPECPECGGSGWITVINDNGTVTAKSCKCRERQIRKNRKAFAEVPAAFEENRITNFIAGYYSGTDRELIDYAVKVAKAYIENYQTFAGDGIGLYLWSRTKGSGKTRLAATIANELLDKGVRVKFATSPAILQAIRASWSREKGDDLQPEEKIIFDLISADLLIIDDFGVEEAKAWIGERFYNIVNERYIANRPTIYTANLPMEELKYDDRIVNRIAEKSSVLKFPEVSVRLIKKAINEKKMKEVTEGAWKK